MSETKKVIAVALDINKIPYNSDVDVIFTPGTQRIWYTTNTQSIEIPKRILLFDSLLNSFFKKFSKKSNKHDVLKFNYFANKVARYLKDHPYDAVIFENEQLKNKVLPNFKNKNEYVVEDTLA